MSARTSAKDGNGAHVALLRGINVGGNNKLPMKDLVAHFTAAGASDVKSYIQSGNVVFRAPAALAKRIPTLIAKMIADQHGLTVPVVVRSADQLFAVSRANPFLAKGGDEKALHVLFLADPPTKDRVAALDPARSPPDTFAVKDSEVYLHLPNGMARTKLTNAYFDSKLATISTARNWRTVLTLLEMTAA